MTFQEFVNAIAHIAHGRYSSAKVESTNYTSGAVGVQFSAYIDGVGWTDDHDTPRDAIAQMAVMDVGLAPEGATLESVGEIHAEGSAGE